MEITSGEMVSKNIDKRIIRVKSFSPSRFLKLFKTKKIVILRGFLDKKNLQLQNFKFLKESKKYKIIKKSGPHAINKRNFSRVDNGRFGKYSRYCITHTKYFWNKKDLYYNEFRILKRLRNKIFKIKSYGNVEIKNNNKYFNVPKILEYKNNGYLSKHFDENNKERIPNFLVCLDDNLNNKYSNGGLCYWIKKKPFLIQKKLELGDIIVHDFSMKHSIKKIKSRTSRLSLSLSLSPLLN